MATLRRDIDLVFAVIQGPGGWGWQWKLGAPEGAYGLSLVALLLSAVINVAGLNAALFARLFLLTLFVAATATWAYIGFSDLFASKPTIRIFLRLSMIVLLVGSHGAMVNNLLILRMWPLAFVTGFEAYLTLNFVGALPPTLTLWRDGVLSVVHVALTLVLLSVWLLDIWGLTTSDAALLYVSAHVLFGLAIASVEIANRTARIEQSTIATARQKGRLEGVASRTAWLHNTVINEIAGLRNTAIQADAQPVVQEINRIEDQFRDEYLNLGIEEANSVGLGSIFWRYHRRHAPNGTVITQPPAEINRQWVSGNDGKHVRDFLDIAVANAIKAGAHNLKILASVSDTEIVVGLLDDGPGFDPALIHAGGELTRLDRDLEGTLVAKTVGQETLVQATITRSNHHG